MYSHERYRNYGGIAMFNISEEIIQSPDVSFLIKLETFFLKDIYQADGVKDIREHTPNIICPWHKRFPFFFDDTSYAVWIILNNVGLRLMDFDTIEKSRYFSIHDKTGGMVALWQPDETGYMFRPARSFEELVKEEGLESEDFVHEIHIFYILKLNLAIIANVYKGIPSKPHRKNKVEKVKNNFLTPTLHPLPA